MRNFVFAAVALACLAGAAGTAQAQYYYYREEIPSWRFWRDDTRTINCRVVNNMPSFSNVDRNDDNFLTRWELRRMGFGSAYDDLDMNYNGVVTRGEVSRARMMCDRRY